MELKLNVSSIPEIEVGDLVVASNGTTCHVVDDSDFNTQFPIRLVNLNTCEIVNGFPNLEGLNIEKVIKYDISVVRVIKSNELKLSLKEV